MMRGAGWSLLLAAMLGASAARAQEGGEPLEQAKAYFNMGAQLYAAGKFTAALQNFEEAYKIAPRPALLFSMAQAERRQYFIDRNPAHLRKAIGYYRDYIGKVEQGGRRAEAAQALSELELLSTKLDSAAPAPGPQPATPPPAAPSKPTLSVMATQVKGARIVVDGKAAADEGLFSEEVNPGKHSIAITADGYFDETREVMVQSTPVALDIALKERPARLRVDTDAGAQISVDGRLVGVAPLSIPVDMPAGTHVISILRTGREAFSTEVDLARGEEKTLPVKLERTSQRYVSYGLLGAAGASFIAAGVFSLQALHQQTLARDIQNQRATQNIDASQLDAYNKAVQARDNRYRPAAEFSFGAGAALGSVGLLLYLFDQPSLATSRGPRESNRPNEPRRPEPSLLDQLSAAPLLGPGLAGASLGGRF
jgi:tetratricopeptide (TPR) repeat protein